MLGEAAYLPCLPRVPAVLEDSAATRTGQRHSGGASGRGECGVGGGGGNANGNKGWSSRAVFIASG
jgi:hypothetical protein